MSSATPTATDEWSCKHETLIERYDVALQQSVVRCEACNRTIRVEDRFWVTRDNPQREIRAVVGEAFGKRWAEKLPLILQVEIK